MEKKELVRIKKIITQNLALRFDFIPHDSAKIKGIIPEPAQEFGFLFRKFTLDQVRKWCDLGEYEDPKILQILDEMSAKRQIKIFRCETNKDLHHNDIGLVAELGRGLREATVSGMKIVEVIYYWQPGKALSQKDFLWGDHTILKPSERVKELREIRDRHFKERFGRIDFEIENRLHREDLIEEVRFKEAVLTVAKDVKKRAVEEKDA